MAFVEHVFHEPSWLKMLTDDVIVACIQPYSFMGQIGYRYWPPETDEPRAPWVIAAYPMPNVVRGSDPNDGAAFVSGFRFNVAHLLSVLVDVDEVAWNMPSKYNNGTDGPEISVRGTFAGRYVWIRFFQLPPSDEPPAYAVNPQTNEVVELSIS